MSTYFIHVWQNLYSFLFHIDTFWPDGNVPIIDWTIEVPQFFRHVLGCDTEIIQISSKELKNITQIKGLWLAKIHWFQKAPLLFGARPISYTVIRLYLMFFWALFFTDKGVKIRVCSHFGNIILFSVFFHSIFVPFV